MILLTGPTGCGKTTTLYSILQLLNTPEKNIVTIEDPVEYCLEGITQVQIKPAAGRTFASALRSIVRQDPDIILVGEIRDSETAEIAVSAALTGHLVLSTLHTNNAAGAISRLVNLGIPPYLVASCLLGTVAQRLVRIICPECKTAYHPKKWEEQQFLNALDNQQDEIQLYQGSGCNFCMGRHYYGRKAFFEILCISSETRNLIKNGASDEEIASQAINEGMKTLRQSGIEEVLNGTTTLEELLRQVDMRKK
jgi:type IV pilus assembly protein PilB